MHYIFYRIISVTSFLIRFYLCYNTIDNIPIIYNPIANFILLETISIYSILMIITRRIVSVFYKKGEAPILGAIAYFIIYIINLGITYGIMKTLTYFNILPLHI